MSNKELLDKIINILVDAVNYKIGLYRPDPEDPWHPMIVGEKKYGH